jgi:hypothetical protein
MAAGTAAIIGAVSAGVGAVMSFAQVAEQQKNIQKAQEAAAKFMSEARKKIEVNYMDQLSINKEPYELQREALLSSGAQAIQAAAEGDRGAAAAAGRVQMAQTEAQGQIRSEMGKELSDLEKLSAQEESRLRDIGVQLDLGEAEGAQRAMADAEEAKARSMTQGFQGLQGIATNVAQLVPLYMQTGAGKAFDKSEAAYMKAIGDKKLSQAFYDKTTGKPLSYQQALGVAKQTPALGQMQYDNFYNFTTGKGRNFFGGIDWANFQVPTGQQTTTGQRGGAINQNQNDDFWEQFNIED